MRGTERLGAGHSFTRNVDGDDLRSHSGCQLYGRLSDGTQTEDGDGVARRQVQPY